MKITYTILEKEEFGKDKNGNKIIINRLIEKKVPSYFLSLKQMENILNEKLINYPSYAPINEQTRQTEEIAILKREIKLRKQPKKWSKHDRQKKTRKKE